MSINVTLNKRTVSVAASLSLSYTDLHVFIVISVLHKYSILSISFGMYLQTKCSMLGPLFQSSLNKTCMFLCKTEKGNFGFAIIYEMFTINFIQNVL